MSHVFVVPIDFTSQNLDKTIVDDGHGEENFSENEEKKNEDGSGDAMVDKQNKFVGIFLAAVSGLFFTLCSVMVKLLKRIDPSEVLLFRAIVQFLITIPIMIYSKANPLGPKDLRILVYVQGVIGCLTVTCIFIGFARFRSSGFGVSSTGVQRTNVELIWLRL